MSRVPVTPYGLLRCVSLEYIHNPSVGTYVFTDDVRTEQVERHGVHMNAEVADELNTLGPLGKLAFSLGC